MKRLLMVTIVLFFVKALAEDVASMQPHSVADVAMSTAQQSADFLEKLRQDLGPKDGGVEKVRPVVDVSADSFQAGADLEGDVDFDFEENAGTGIVVDEPVENRQEDLPREEMSGYFADAGIETIEGIGK